VSVGPAECFPPWCSLPISTHFTAPPEISLCPYRTPACSFHRLSRVEPWDLTAGLKKPPTDAFTPNHIRINACILCLTRGCWHRVSRCLFPRYRHCFFSGKRSSRPVGLLPSQRHCSVRLSPIAEKFPTAASRRSLGRVSVPVWLIILSDQLLIIALVSYCLTN
ncbi:ATP synthase subunit alpha, partial [Quillaja saponaria]